MPQIFRFAQVPKSPRLHEGQVLSWPPCQPTPTRWPFFHCVTLAPSSSITPAISCPGTRGYEMPGKKPSFVIESLWQTPQACTLMRTCPASGLGISRSTISKSPPAFEICATFMGAIPTFVVAIMPPLNVSTIVEKPYCYRWSDRTLRCNSRYRLEGCEWGNLELNTRGPWERLPGRGFNLCELSRQRSGVAKESRPALLPGPLHAPCRCDFNRTTPNGQAL